MSKVNQEGRRSAGTVMGAIGMVAALLALAVSLSGIADASGQRSLVKRGDIARGAVTAGNLANGAVHAKALASSAVTTPKLAKGSVNRRVLKKASVTQRSIAAGAVTAEALAPGSVHGVNLATPTIHVAPIADVDQVAENGTWTASNTEVAVCGPGETIIGAGFAFTEPGNREVSFLQASPYVSGTGDGVAGRISSNSGGTAQAQVMAICLP